MPSFTSPDYVHLRMAPNESQMQLINMDANGEPSTPSTSPCFNEPNGSPYVPTTEPSAVPRIGYRSGKGSILWWRARTSLEKLLLVLLLFFVLLSIFLLVLTFRSDSRDPTPISSSTTLPPPTTDGLPPSTSSSPLPPSSTTPPLPPVCTTAGCVRAANYLLDAMNTSADPCDNFFEYACGQWNYAHPIPDDTPVYGTFSYVREIVRQQLRVSLESDTPTTSKSIRMAKASYKICMNVTELEELKSKPLLEALNKLGKWPLIHGDEWKGDTFDLTQMIASSRSELGSEVFFSSYIYADSKNTTRNALIMDQGVLSLGRGMRDYYLNGTMFATHMAALSKHIYQTMHILLTDAGSPTTDKLNETVKEIIEFEKKMAAIMTAEDDRRNSTRQYNKRTLADLYTMMPQVDWVNYLHRIAPESVHDILHNETEIVVLEVEYMSKISSLLSTTPSRTIADYLLWKIVNSAAKYLDDRYEDVRHEMNKILTGQQMRSPRWKDCTGIPSGFFPLAAGAVYVGEHFDSSDKKEAESMIAAIRESFAEIVKENDWMDEETKGIAIEKAEAMVELIGYPDIILDHAKLDEKYDNLDISLSDSYFGMVRKVVVYTNNKDFNKLKKPFDKLDFDTSPAIVNAFYSTERNSITFPAGILQPPFFSGSFPKAINYGAIGAVIGHEITHGFDDQGSQYDKNGNLVNWWNEKSAKGFESRKQCITKQYSSYSVPDTDLKVNGKLTLGENIADNGGVKEAFRAFRAHGGENEARLPGLQHLSNDQVFFLSYANFWCGHKTKAAAVQQVLQDEHSPEIFRVIGVLSNFPAFAEAFSCPVGSKLNPSVKCPVW